MGIPLNNRRGKLRDVVGLLIIALIIVVVGFAIYIHRNRGVEYEITFQDASGISRGDAVTLAGVEAGKVVNVDYDAATQRAVVRVRVDEEFRDKILAPPNSSARIIKEGILFPSRRIDIVNRPVSGNPIEGGETAEGLESWASMQVYLGKAKASNLLAEGKSALADFTEMAQDQLNDLKDWAEEKELKQKIEEIRLDIQQGTVDATKPAREALGRAVERAKEVGAELTAKGRPDLAADLESTILEVKERVEEFTSDDAEPAETPAEPLAEPPAP